MVSGWRTSSAAMMVAAFQTKIPAFQRYVPAATYSAATAAGGFSLNFATTWAGASPGGVASSAPCWM